MKTSGGEECVTKFLASRKRFHRVNYQFALGRCLAKITYFYFRSHCAPYTIINY